MNPLFVKGLSLEFTLQTIIIHTDRKTRGEGFFKFILGFSPVFIFVKEIFHTTANYSKTKTCKSVSSIDQRTIKPDRTVSNYKRTCPAILKSRPTCKVSKTYSWMFLLISRKEINLFNMQLPHHHHHHINVYFFVIIFIFLLLV